MIAFSLWHRGPSGYRYWNKDKELTKKGIAFCLCHSVKYCLPDLLKKTERKKTTIKNTATLILWGKKKQFISMLISFYLLAFEEVAMGSLWLEPKFIKQNKMIAVDLSIKWEKNTL